MGESALAFYKTKLKKEYKFALVVSFLAALFIHFYKFVNTLPNHDALLNYYADQNILGSGRWALSIVCGISSYFDLPWVIGVISCLFMALTVVTIIALFKIKNPVLISLIGLLIVGSPSITETFFFLYTADGYMIAMFLSALAVYLSRIGNYRRSHLILSSILICISCSIYQAYVSFALVLAVCYFIDALLDNNYCKHDYFNWIIRQILIFSTALLIYYIIWKLLLHITATPVNNYQGISDVGSLNAHLLTGGLFKTIKITILYFLQRNIFANDITIYSMLGYCFCFSLMVIIVISCVKSKLFQRKWAMVLFILSLLSIPPFACIWYFTSDSVQYRVMMLQSFILVFVLAAILYEKWASYVLKNIICILLLCISLNNAVMANISYFCMNLCYERTYAEGLEIMIDIRDLERNHDINHIAILGSRADSLRSGAFLDEKIHMLSWQLEESLLFDSEHFLPFMKSTFGLDIPPVSVKDIQTLWELDEVNSMGCWPEDHSISIIKDTLVIKFSDTDEHYF